MVWIPEYFKFLYRAEQWIQRSKDIDSSEFPGAVAYAKRQAASWAKIAGTSGRIFQAVKPRVVNVWGGE
jgi:hypothetical protein